jgi:hypothetical protein
MQISLERKLDDFVGREVIHCASMLVHQLLEEKKDDPEYFVDMYLGQVIEGTEDDPEYDEIFEHWIVSEHLATQLEKHGESITRDFYGFTIWGRTCTGQAISLDYVIGKIYEELHANDI